MNAVGGDQQVGLDFRHLGPATPVLEHGMRLRPLAIKALDRVASENPRRTLTRHYVAQQQQMEFAAMHRKLRKVIARSQAARLAPDRLTMLVEICQLGGFDGGGAQFFKQATEGLADLIELDQLGTKALADCNQDFRGLCGACACCPARDYAGGVSSLY